MTGLNLGGPFGRLVAERDRAVGDLTASEVRQVVETYLAPWEVAQLARGVLGRQPAADIVHDLKAGYRGHAGGGTILETTGKGIQVRLNDPSAPAGYRAGLIRWNLLVQVIRDGTTPGRLAALTTALREHDQQAARQAARDVVLAGPAATQLDLLDQLDQLATQSEDVERAEGVEDMGRPRRRGRARCRRCGLVKVVPLVWDGEDYATTCGDCDGLMVAVSGGRGAASTTSSSGSPSSSARSGSSGRPSGRSPARRGAS